MPEIRVINNVGEDSIKSRNAYQDPCSMADPPNCPCEFADHALPYLPPVK